MAEPVAREPENTPVDLFGGNSEGYLRMEDWLRVMCKGCRHESAGLREGTGQGGILCEVADRAVSDPYAAEMPEWSADAAPRPERLAELGGGPWPVCMSYEARKRRSDAGSRRAPRGIEPLFAMERAG